MIIKMEKEHIKAVAEIERLCFSHPWSEENLRESFDSSCNCFYISLEENKIQGYIGLTIVADEGYILNIAVHPDFRRRGIGKALIQRIIDLGVDTDLAFVTLEVRASNCPAISLYHQFGFEKVGERRDYYSNPKENAVLMTKYFNSEKE